MNSKPKNFTEAISELENGPDHGGSSFKAKLKREMESLEEQIEKLKPKLEELKDIAHEELHKGKEKVEVQMKENPWLALGIVGLIGMILGFLISGKVRSRRSD